MAMSSQVLDDCSSPLTCRECEILFKTSPPLPSRELRLGRIGAFFSDWHGVALCSQLVSKEMDCLSDLGCTRLENSGTPSSGNHTQSDFMQHVIGDRVDEGQMDRVRLSPIAQEAREFEKLVSLVKRSSNRATLLTLSVVLDAEIASLTEQVATVLALATESQRKARQATLEFTDRATTAEHTRATWLPAKTARVTLF